MRTLWWEDEALNIIDQRYLPWELRIMKLRTSQEVVVAIRDMVVRGAPAIGVAGAYGVALAARQSQADEAVSLGQDLEQAAAALIGARPTAVNLRHLVEQMLRIAGDQTGDTVGGIRSRLLAAAAALADQDVATNLRLADYGSGLIRDGDTVLHHCNTGALATVDYGTALGVIRMAHERGRRFQVLLDETRPRLQGARLSAWELERYGVPYHIIADEAAGYFMQRGQVNLVLVGADCVAANGDVANKIGTYMLAVLARENGVPFYAVVPRSTINLNLASGQEIPIEERDPHEVTTPYGLALMPAHYPALNPAFDVTPHRYVTGIITDAGIAYPPFTTSLRALASG